jgi:hypothetical protein
MVNIIRPIMVKAAGFSTLLDCLKNFIAWDYCLDKSPPVAGGTKTIVYLQDTFAIIKLLQKKQDPQESSRKNLLLHVPFRFYRILQ